MLPSLGELPRVDSIGFPGKELPVNTTDKPSEESSGVGAEGGIPGGEGAAMRYSVEFIPKDSDGRPHYRVTDNATDSRVATCYLRENADMIVAALNARSASSGLPAVREAGPAPEPSEEAIKAVFAEVGCCDGGDQCESSRSPGAWNMLVCCREHYRRVLRIGYRIDFPHPSGEQPTVATVARIMQLARMESGAMGEDGWWYESAEELLAALRLRRGDEEGKE